MSLCIIIPAYNAAKTISKVVNELRREFSNAEILVINDGSNDQTSERLSSLPCKVITSNKNYGVGHALQSGIAYALERNFTAIATIGADDQRDINDLRSMYKHLLESEIDLVVGSKFIGKIYKMPISRRIGNNIVNYLFNFLFKTRFTDITSGFRVMNRKAASLASSLQYGYSFDADFRIAVLKMKLVTTEVPVAVYYHSESTRMRSGARVGFEICKLIIKRRFAE